MSRWLCLLVLLPGLAFAHGGGLDANGCHHDRKNGGYHCHRGPGANSSPQASSLFAAPQPVPQSQPRSSAVVYRCPSGYTTIPAPGCTVVAVGDQQRATPAASQSFMAKPQQLTVRGGASYANCSEARAAGAAPVRAGDPGYNRKLDRDGDGVGCE
jgi:hypothetical protein